MSAGPVVALGGLVAGLLAGERLGPAPAVGAAAAGAVGLVAAWCTAGPVRVVCAAVALGALGCASMQRALDGQEHHGWAAAVARGDDALVSGTLASDPVGGRFRAEASVRAGGPGRILYVRAAPDDAARLQALESGDRVALSGRLRPLDPADRAEQRARWRHAVAVLEDARVEAFAPPSAPLWRLANALRGAVRRGAEALPPTPRALALGFVLGDTRGVPDDVAGAYRDAGLSHLLAVSGQNVAFVLALVAPLLRRLPLGARTAAAGTTVLVFAAATRFEPSVVRASALAGVTILATFSGRPAGRVRALVLALAAALLVDPFLVHSVGFRLSAAASAGIVCLARPIARRLAGPAPLRDALAVSGAAQLGVAPVLLATFGEVPLATPLTNLLAAPAAALLGAAGLPVLGAAGVVPALAPVLTPVVGLALAWVGLVARAGAAAGLAVDGRGAAVVSAVVAVATLARRARRAPAARDRTRARGAVPPAAPR